MTPVGLLLAAGTSSRFNAGNKLLHSLDGEPLVRRAARRLIESPATEPLVVLGHDAERVERALGALRDHVTVVYNDRYEAGQSTSVHAGAREVLTRGGSAALVALGDMPWVAPETYERLVAAADGDHAVVHPSYRGCRGNPVLLDEAILRRLASLSGDVGARVLFDDASVQRVPVDDAGVRADIDTVADLTHRT